MREEQRQRAAAAVTPVLEKVEQEVGEGHGKASAGAAAALRNAFKDHARHLDAALEARVHAALGAAGELEGWQRWRADQLREELVAKAEALLQRKPRVKVKPRVRIAPPTRSLPKRRQRCGPAAAGGPTVALATVEGHAGPLPDLPAPMPTRCG